MERSGQRGPRSGRQGREEPTRAQQRPPSHSIDIKPKLLPLPEAMPPPIKQRIPSRLLNGDRPRIAIGVHHRRVDRSVVTTCS